MPLIDKIFSPVVLVIINLLIIFAAEFVGGGEFFFMQGAIHVVALLFIALGVLRIFSRTYTYDPIFEKFVRMTLAAFIIFSASHILEFLSMMVFYTYSDATFANVVNLYIISFALIIIGAESFLRTISHKLALTRIMFLAILVFAVLTALFLYNSELISLESGSPAPFLYFAVLLVVSLSGIYIILKIKRMVPVSSAFANYLTASLILIIFSTLPYIFYEFIEEGFSYIGRNQIVYMSHFLFFAALSLLFLSFTKLSWEGIYAEARKIDEGNKLK